ncbi:MAG TPA: PD-(D/E)XK nuclease family protein [Blastocatellia bacterium]|nr:PD-(D/E)XK nuclease family protein [Blastocatellia bacterium]
MLEPQRARLIISHDSATRLEAAADWLKAFPPDAEILVLSASHEAGDEFVRQAALKAGSRFGLTRMTLERLAVNLAAPILARSARVPTTSLSLEALTARAVHLLVSESALSYFAPVAKRPGFPRAVARTLTELRMNAVDIEALRDLPRGGVDIAALAECVDRELVAAGLADRATIYEAALESAQHSDVSTQRVARPFASPFSCPFSCPLLLLDLSIQTTREAALIKALAKRAPQTLATAARGDTRSIAMLERALGSTPAEPDSPQIAAASGSQIPADRRRSASRQSAKISGKFTKAVSSLTTLKAHLFEDSKPEKKELDDSVTLGSSPGEARECVEIARRIQAEAAAGIAFDKIAVFLRSPAEYRPHLEEAFRRAAIPAYFARGTSRPDAAGRALLALLACRAENFSARRFAEYTSLAQVPDADSQREPDASWAPPSSEMLPIGVEPEPAPEADFGSEPLPVDLESEAKLEGTLRAPWRWERLLVESSVIGGKDRWKMRIEGLEAELRLRRKELVDEGEDTRVAVIDGQLRDIGHLREFALPLIDELAALPDRGNWKDWLTHLRKLAQVALRNPDRVLETLVELEPMSPIGPIDLNEVQIVLTPRLRELAVPPPRRRYGCVFVGSTDAARGMSFDIVFVPGLAEKLFPRKVIEDPILLDEQRRRIDNTDLLTQHDRIQSERLALKLAVGAASTRVHLSYPRIDVQQARPRVPSFYGLEALRASEGHLPGFDKLMRRAEQTSSGRLGWPAPANPGVAIDEAEYDLALLAPLIDADPETVAGTANYLLSTNQHLARALRSRSRRWLKRWTPSDGLVEPDDLAREALAAHQLGSRSFSPTALQNYAACPYRFFLQAVHRLQPREEPAAIEVIDPLTRGSLFHKVQYQVLTMLREAGLLPLTPSTCARAIDLVDDVLNRVALTFQEKLAPAIDKVWEDGINTIRADLREWLRRASEAEDGWVPFKFELGFGLADRDREDEDPASVPDPVRLDLHTSTVESVSLALRGSIDLVERHVSGKLRATDHKTGKARASDGVVVGGGKYLQPVLYALACERLLEGSVEAGRLYYCTSDGGFTAVEVPLTEISRAEGGDVAHIIGRALEEGFLPAAPEKGACDWCDYRAVCGPLEYIRTSRKPGAALYDLKRLRELP